MTAASVRKGIGFTSSLISTRSMSTVIVSVAIAILPTRLRPTTDGNTSAVGCTDAGSTVHTASGTLSITAVRSNDVVTSAPVLVERTLTRSVLVMLSRPAGPRSSWRAVTVEGSETPVTTFVAARTCTMKENSGPTSHGRVTVPSSGVPPEPLALDVVSVTGGGT